MLFIDTGMVVWHSGNVTYIELVTLRQAQLVLGWLTVRDSRKSRQKMAKTRHTIVKIAKITAKSPQFI